MFQEKQEIKFRLLLLGYSNTVVTPTMHSFEQSVTTIAAVEALHDLSLI